MPDPTNLKDDAQKLEQEARTLITEVEASAKTKWRQYLAAFGVVTLIACGIAFCVKHG